MTPTLFTDIYSSFFSKITDDMYMELTKVETEADAKDIMMNALPHFEFPRVDIYNFDEEIEEYNIELSKEEINIIATYMVVEWIGRQLANIDLTRMQYSGSDFKFTSQANHLAKLTELKKVYTQKGFHLQRLYKRRKKDEKGIMRSTFGDIMNVN